MATALPAFRPALKLSQNLPARHSPQLQMKHVKFTALQFHPEVTHTPDGAKLLGNFVNKIAGIKSDVEHESFP